MTDTPRKFQVGDTVKILPGGMDDTGHNPPYVDGDIGIVMEANSIEITRIYDCRVLVPYKPSVEVLGGPGWWIFTRYLELVKANSDA